MISGLTFTHLGLDTEPVWCYSGVMTKTQTAKWHRLDSPAYDGYELGSWQITDNGAGVGPSKGSGRWALVYCGKWIANYDTLAEAKAAAK